MTTLTTAWMLAGVWGSGFVFGAVVASGRRRPRGNGSGGPTTPKPPIKPQPSGSRMMTIGYQPLPRSGRTLPPPREP